MPLLFKKGAKLLITLNNNQTFEGEFYKGNDTKITLKNVSEYPSNVKQNSYYHFYQMEIKNVTQLRNEHDDDDEEDTEESSLASVSEAKFDLIKDFSHEYVFVSSVDSRFFSAVESLNKCSEIAVMAFACQGRLDTLRLLALASRFMIYVFDLQVTDGHCPFHMGLKDILEAKYISKVVHDSRLIADCLLHCYKVNLTNVFDTAVADYMIIEKESGVRLSEMRKFSLCVDRYLRINETIIKNMDVKSEHLSNKQLSNDVKLFAAIQVFYLLELKDKMFNTMMYNFNKSVEVYMNSLRNADISKVFKSMKPDIPKDLKDLNLRL